MTEIMLWMAGHQTTLVVGGFALAEVITLSVLLVTAHRVRMMKKEMDKVGEQVKNYLNIVLENDEEDVSETDDIKMKNLRRDEEENRIISTVLQEIFP